jgi:hypothetical protein
LSCRGVHVGTFNSSQSKTTTNTPSATMFTTNTKRLHDD